MDALVRPIFAQYALSSNILATSVSDLSDQDVRTRSRGGTGPSIAWTIGHLCNFKIKVLQLLGRSVDNPFAAKFEKTAASDGSDYPTLKELMKSWDALQADLASALGATTAVQLEAPLPGAAPHDEKKVLDTVIFLSWHEGYHIGAIGAIRKEFKRTSIAELVTGKKQ